MALVASERVVVHGDYLYIPDAQPTPLGAAALPRVSFCIPTKNRARTIGACLRSIRAQAYPNIEIVVVDNGSTDNTVAIARRHADIVTHHGGQLGAVRQHSIDVSSGAILALFDDDIVIPHAHWLRDAVAALMEDERISTVWPVLVAPPDASAVTRCFFALNDAIFAARRDRPSAVFGGGNSLFRRDAIAKIGGFNASIGFGEDFDLAARLKQAGYQVVLHVDPLIHDTMYSLREIYRKQQWGAQAVQEHGAELLAQSYSDAAREQVVIGIRAMLRGVVVERKLYWGTYPLLLLAKTWPYVRAALARAHRQHTPHIKRKTPARSL